MAENTLPRMLTESETKCCPRFDPGPWDGKRFILKDRLFLKVKTRSLFHIPLNLGSVFTRTMRQITAADATPDDFVVLSWDPSMWRGEHYFAVTKEIPGAEVVRMSGTFSSKVFEGPYADAPKWLAAVARDLVSRNETAERTYLYYTTCPNCAKHYGKNYVVALAKVS